MQFGFGFGLPLASNKADGETTVPNDMVAPQNRTAPQVVGEPVVTNTVEADEGEWVTKGQEEIQYQYQWYANGSALDGENSETLTLDNAVLAKPIILEVLATNEYGTSSALSSPTNPVLPQPGEIDILSNPTIQGIARVNETLSVNSSGSWTSNPASTTQTYAWFVDEETTPFASGQSVLLNNNQLGKRVRLRVTVDNGINQEVIYSDYTASVIAAFQFPGITQAPVISGANFREGTTLTVSNGSWNSGFYPITGYAYQWYVDGEVLEGATTNQLLLTEAMIGLNVYATVTATNELGSTTATAKSVGPVLVFAAAPTIINQPQVSPYTARVGETVTVSNGTWNDNNSPITEYLYQWYVDGVLIEGATGQTLEVLPEYLTKRFRPEVTAVNGVGSTTVFSITSNTVRQVQSPANVTRPTVDTSDGTQVGDTLVATGGTWNERNVETTYSNRWVVVRSPVLVLAENTLELVIPPEAAGFRIRFDEFATNAGGTNISSSLNTAIIQAAFTVPVNSALPVVSGEAIEGQTLTGTNGTWTHNGAGVDGYTYQWLRDGVEISGATASTYLLTSSDVDAEISLEVTAYNEVGDGTPAVSAAVGPILAATGAPINETPPAFANQPAINTECVVTPGVWNERGSEITSTVYTWYADDVEIEGVTGNTYTVDPIYEGAILEVTETVTNGVGSASAETGPSEAVQGSYDPDSIAYFEAMEVEPPVELMVLIDGVIKDMKATEFWDKMGWLSLHAVHDEQAARINIKNPTQVATRMEDYPFTPYQGYKGDPAQHDALASGWLDTGVQLSSLGASRTDLTVAAWCSRNEPEPLYEAGVASSIPMEVGLLGSNLVGLVSRRNQTSSSAATLAYSYRTSLGIIQNSIAYETANAFPDTLMGFSRLASTYFRWHIGKTHGNIGSQTGSTAVASFNITIGKGHDPSSGGQGRSLQRIKFVGVGLLVSDAAWDATCDSLEAYMTAVAELEVEEPAPGWVMEANTFFAEMDVQPEDDHKAIIDAFITDLKDAGVWDKLDWIGIHAMHDEQAARINLKDPSVVATRMENYPFIAYSGYQGDSGVTESGYLDTNQSIADSPNFQRDSAMVAIWGDPSFKGGSTGTVGDVGVLGDFNTRLLMRRFNSEGPSASQTEARINSTTLFYGGADSLYTGIHPLFAAIRRSSSQVVMKAGKSTLATHTSSSVAIANSALTFGVGRAGTDTDGRSDRLISMSFVGGSLDDTEWNALVDACDAYFIGLIPLIP